MDAGAEGNGSPQLFQAGVALEPRGNCCSTLRTEIVLGESATSSVHMSIRAPALTQSEVAEGVLERCEAIVTLEVLDDRCSARGAKLVVIKAARAYAEAHVPMI